MIDEAGNPGKASHWESGVISPQEDGTIVLSCAHDSARVEVLRGHIDESKTISGILSIKFESVLHGNDPRMVASTREWLFNGSELKYTMRMATHRSPQLTQHLSASLLRSAAE